MEVHPLTTNLILQTPSPLPWLLLFYSSFCLPLHHRLWRSLSFQHHHSLHFPHSVHHHHNHYLHYHHSSHSVRHHHHHNLFHHLPDLWFMWAWEFWPSQPVSYSFSLCSLHKGEEKRGRARRHWEWEWEWVRGRETVGNINFNIIVFNSVTLIWFIFGECVEFWLPFISVLLINLS